MDDLSDFSRLIKMQPSSFILFWITCLVRIVCHAKLFRSLSWILTFHNFVRHIKCIWQNSLSLWLPEEANIVLFSSISFLFLDLIFSWDYLSHAIFQRKVWMSFLNPDFHNFLPPLLSINWANIVFCSTPRKVCVPKKVCVYRIH